MDVRPVIEPGAPSASVPPVPELEPEGGPEEAFPRSGRPGPTAIRIVRDGLGESIDLAGLPEAVADPATIIWVDLTDPTVEHILRVAGILGLHPLLAGNIAEQSQRARIEEVGEHIHIVLFAMAFVGQVQPIELDFVLGKQFLLTVHHADWDPLGSPHLIAGLDQAVGRGPDFLLYALGDWIVDGYFPVMDRLADEIDELQDDAVQTASPPTLQRLLALKRELIALRRAASPAREIFNQLTNREIGLVSSDHVIYLRDVYDHLLRVTDELDNYRDLVSGTLEVYLSTINNNLSVIMKRLTGVTVLLAGIGAIAGIFGMSEAGTALRGAEAGGFWAIAIGTVVVAAGAAYYLRRIDWI